MIPGAPIDTVVTSVVMRKSSVEEEEVKDITDFGGLPANPLIELNEDETPKEPLVDERVNERVSSVITDFGGLPANPLLELNEVQEPKEPPVDERGPSVRINSFSSISGGSPMSSIAWGKPEDRLTIMNERTIM